MLYESMHITSKLLINNTSSYYTYQLVLREHTYYDSYSTTIDTYYTSVYYYSSTRGCILLLQLEHALLVAYTQSMDTTRVAKCARSMHIIHTVCIDAMRIHITGTLASTLVVLQYSSTLEQLVASPVCILCIQHTPSTLCIQYSFTTSSYA